MSGIGIGIDVFLLGICCCWGKFLCFAGMVKKRVAFAYAASDEYSFEYLSKCRYQQQYRVRSLYLVSAALQQA